MTSHEPGLLLRAARLVRVGDRPAPDGPVDLRIAGGRVVEISAVGDRLTPYAAEQVIDAGGRWAIPGLWDAHTHPVMWALAQRRIDLVGVTSAADTVARVRRHMEGSPGGDSLVLGYGQRSATWSQPPTVADLDAVTGERPVALASGDGHNGWLNSAALRLLGLPSRTGVLTEDEWYAAYPRLESLDPDSVDPTDAVREAVAAAHAKGVVGMVDFEFGSSFHTWPDRVAKGLDSIRVRAATYADDLEQVAALGLRTGDPLLDGHDLVTMGPLKVISDGSLNTLTAWCCDPYVGGEHLEHPRGLPNLPVEELTRIMVRAREIGLTAAIHAIGDQAVASTLDAFAASGQIGSMEHAQLVRWGDVQRLAEAGITASVQPTHALDDRDVSHLWWADRTNRLYAFRAMLDAGVPLALGSDAPVSPLDPWLAIAAAVHRSGDDRPAWHPEQAITVAEALASSTDGQGTLAPGSRGDVVLLDADPLTTDGAGDDSGERAAYLRSMPVAATVVAGRPVHSTL
jgi:predicted amidohydrolase YtcJ